MPLPIIPVLLGGAAAAAGAVGVATAVDGAAKMKDANDTMKATETRHNENIRRFERENEKTTGLMDKLGKKELEILTSFEEFTNLIEKIHNRPEFKAYNKDNVVLPKYNAEELQKVSVGAGVLLGGLGGAAVGTAGGFAAAGATTSAVMALGTASTGTAIASLSGAAATNATLAALGGGAIAAGGGGIAAGTAVLGAATLGVGLLVGGIIFNVTGSSLSDKADEAEREMLKAEKEINKICDYLSELYYNANRFNSSLQQVKNHYDDNMRDMNRVINVYGKTDWLEYAPDEKLLVENTVLLVGLLYKMCQVQLVLKDKDNDQLNEVNISAIDSTIHDANNVLNQIA